MTEKIIEETISVQDGANPSLDFVPVEMVRLRVADSFLAGVAVGMTTMVVLMFVIGGVILGIL